MKAHEKKFKEEPRIWIYILCLIDAIYIFLYYGIFSGIHRLRHELILEMFRFFINFSACTYYVYKAGYYEVIKPIYVKPLYLWALGCLIFTLYANIKVIALSSGEDAKISETTFCTEPIYFAYRVFMITVCLVFFLIYLALRRNISDSDTQFVRK